MWGASNSKLQCDECWTGSTCESVYLSEVGENRLGGSKCWELKVLVPCQWLVRHDPPQLRRRAMLRLSSNDWQRRTISVVYWRLGSFAERSLDWFDHVSWRVSAKWRLHRFVRCKMSDLAWSDISDIRELGFSLNLWASNIGCIWGFPKIVVAPNHQF